MSRTYDRRDLAELAFHYENRDMFGYVLWNSIPKLGVDSTKGSYRGVKEEVYYTQGNMQFSKTGYPNEFDFDDESFNYDLVPYGGSIKRSEEDLSQPNAFGQTRVEMIREAVEFLANKGKLNMEIETKDFLTTTGNYDATLVRDVNAVSTKWSDLNNSDPLVDVQAIKEALYGTPNVMRIGIQMFHTLQRHPKITGASTVSSKNRQFDVDPKVTVEFLSNYFEVEQVIVSRSIYNTTPNAGSMTKGFIWNSAYVSLSYESMAAGDSILQPSFCHALFYNAPGFSNLGGFVAKETVDERAGGNGMRIFDVTNKVQIQTRAQMLGGLLTNAWSA